MQSVPGPSFPFADKVGHLGLYGVLGAALAWGHWWSGKGQALVLIALGALYGLSDEWHQSFVAGREASAGDLATDALGVIVGYFLFSLILNGLSGRRIRKDLQ